MSIIPSSLREYSRSQGSIRKTKKDALFGKQQMLLLLRYTCLKNFFGIFRSKLDFEKKSRGRAASNYQALISPRLLPAILPNRELNYGFSKFLYDKLYDKQCIFDVYIKVWIRKFDLQLFSRTELPKCTPSILMEMGPYRQSCFINSFLYDPPCKTWPFEKFIFELEASHSFKIT